MINLCIIDRLVTKSLSIVFMFSVAFNQHSLLSWKDLRVVDLGRSSLGDLTPCWSQSLSLGVLCKGGCFINGLPSGGATTSFVRPLQESFILL